MFVTLICAHVTIRPILRVSTTVVCYKGISVTSHSPCRHGNIPVADGSCAGGHVGPGLSAPSTATFGSIAARKSASQEHFQCLTDHAPSSTQLQPQIINDCSHTHASYRLIHTADERSFGSAVVRNFSGVWRAQHHEWTYHIIRGDIHITIWCVVDGDWTVVKNEAMASSDRHNRDAVEVWRSSPWL